MSAFEMDRLPDSDITVLMRLPGDDYPVWPGYHDGEQWFTADGCAIDAQCSGPVIGWVDLHAAAEILDGKKGGSE